MPILEAILDLILEDSSLKLSCEELLRKIIDNGWDKEELVQALNELCPKEFEKEADDTFREKWEEAYAADHPDPEPRDKDEDG